MYNVKIKIKIGFGEQLFYTTSKSIIFIHDSVKYCVIHDS